MKIINVGHVGISMRLNTNLTKLFAHILHRSNSMAKTQHEVDNIKKYTVSLGIVESHQKMADTTLEEAKTDYSKTSDDT